MPILVDDVKLNLTFGSASPYAAELNVDFDNILCPEELTALVLAERLEVFFEGKHVMGVMRWLGNFLSNLNIKSNTPPEIITVLDYRWVLSLGQPMYAWDVIDGVQVPLVDLAANNPPPEVSIGISLFAIWKRHVEPLCAQTFCPD